MSEDEITIKTNIWKDGHAVDFSSNDNLSLGASGALRVEFMQELEDHPNIPPGAGNSRVMGKLRVSGDR